MKKLSLALLTLLLSHGVYAADASKDNGTQDLQVLNIKIDYQAIESFSVLEPQNDYENAISQFVQKSDYIKTNCLDIGAISLHDKAYEFSVLTSLILDGATAKTQTAKITSQLKTLFAVQGGKPAVTVAITTHKNGNFAFVYADEVPGRGRISLVTTKIPQLTSSCQDGNKFDSRGYDQTTPEGKEFLASLGINKPANLSHVSIRTSNLEKMIYRYSPLKN